MTQKRKTPLGLAVLLSGTGRTLENLSGRIQSGQLGAQIKIVVSSRPEAYGLQRAAKLAIPNHVVARKAYRSVAAHSTAVFEILRRYDVDLVCYTGWPSLLKIRCGEARSEGLASFLSFSVGCVMS